MDCNCSSNGSSYPENLSYPQMTSHGRNPICGDNACYDELSGTGIPLAMAYVLWQKWGNLYDPGRGLQIGTIFADLDMPFLGCKNTNKSQTGIFPRSSGNRNSYSSQNNSNSCGCNNTNPRMQQRRNNNSECGRRCSGV